MDTYNIDIGLEISETKQKIQGLEQRLKALGDVRVALRALNGTEGTLDPHKDREITSPTQTHHKKRKAITSVMHHNPVGFYDGWKTPNAIEHFINSRNDVETRIPHIAATVFGRKPNSEVGRKCRAAIAAAISVAPNLTTVNIPGGKGGRHVKVIYVKVDRIQPDLGLES